MYLLSGGGVEKQASRGEIFRSALSANKGKFIFIRQSLSNYDMTGNVEGPSHKVKVLFSGHICVLLRWPTRDMLQIFKTSCCKLKHQKCARAQKEGEVGTRSFIFLSRKLLYFSLGLCDYSETFPKMFCRSCAMECPSTANFCHQCGQQLNLSQVSNKAANKAASSHDKEKLLKKCILTQH